MLSDESEGNYLFIFESRKEEAVLLGRLQQAFSRSIRNGSHKQNTVLLCVLLSFLHFHFERFKHEKSRNAKLLSDNTIFRCDWKKTLTFTFPFCCRRMATHATQSEGSPTVCRSLCPSWAAQASVIWWPTTRPVAAGESTWPTSNHSLSPRFVPAAC